MTKKKKKKKKKKRKVIGVTARKTRQCSPTFVLLVPCFRSVAVFFFFIIIIFFFVIVAFFFPHSSSFFFLLSFHQQYRATALRKTVPGSGMQRRRVVCGVLGC